VRSLRFPVLFVVALCVLGVGSASAAEQLAFTPLAHGSGKVGAIPFGFGGGLATSVTVFDQPSAIPTDSETFGPQTGMTRRAVALMRQTDFRRQFVFGVLTTWPTRGYDVRIRTIAVQHIGGGAEQLCVTVARHAPPPGRVVLQERTSVFDYVRVSREAANIEAPTSVVVRGMRGRLLYATNNSLGTFNAPSRPVRARVCHPS